jgi:hypothetical protein
VLEVCFSCIKPYEYPHAADSSRYLSPISPKPDPKEIAWERELARMRLAVYFLYEAMRSTQRSLSPARSLDSAMLLFDRNFPEFAEPGPS